VSCNEIISGSYFDASFFFVWGTQQPDTFLQTYNSTCSHSHCIFRFGLGVSKISLQKESYGHIVVTVRMTRLKPSDNYMVDYFMTLIYIHYFYLQLVS
jgi:hypothetical protein